MPIRVKPAELRQMIQPGLAIRKDNECRIDISTDTIRLRGRSEDRTAYLDYSIPLSADPELSESSAGDFWVNLEKLEQFLKLDLNDVVVISIPPERDDTILVLKSNGLTHRFPPLIRQNTHRLSDVPSSDTLTKISIQHHDFHRAVQVANLVGEELRLYVPPKANYVRFSATSGSNGDEFVYSVPTEQVDVVHESDVDRTIPIGILRYLTPLTPVSDIVSIEATRDYVVYRVDYPTSGADLALYLGDRYDTIR